MCGRYVSPSEAEIEREWHRRCLVPAKGWYEWETIQAPGQKKSVKQPWYILPEDGGPIAFAGLWDRWEKGDHVVDSFTIIVRNSTDAMGRVHDRMAVVLPQKDQAAWLDPKRNEVDDVHAILARTSVQGLIMHRVTSAVSSACSQGAALIDSIDDEIVSAA